jgi:hypothetical protein
MSTFERVLTRFSIDFVCLGGRVGSKWSKRKKINEINLKIPTVRWTVGSKLAKIEKEK